jgi:hypothetical protein
VSNIFITAWRLLLIGESDLGLTEDQLEWFISQVLKLDGTYQVDFRIPKLSKAEYPIVSANF